MEENKEKEVKEKVISQVTFRVNEATGKEITDVLDYRIKKGLSKDMTDMFHQIWNYIKKEKNTFGNFKTGK